MWFLGAIYINKAKVVKSEVFVYNLGTMFYIDSVLFSEDGLPSLDHQDSTSTGPSHGELRNKVEFKII